MNEKLTLFPGLRLGDKFEHIDWPADWPPHNHTPTSVEAAKNIKPDSARLRDLIHGFLVSRGVVGATDNEIAQKFGLDGSTERPRRWELVRAGRVKDSGRTRKPIGSRNKQIVWVSND